ncbi:hypothetical protein EIP91_008912 [Steccherinum ochraceum]|uniref:AB hydrolase-1 domain-containing protein n=1 Tax=Steccherinum ochraceum TaxID=92696 RepID=A0A4R0RRU1_9APHY|nr:hypothetical protein EIP91_008912 [Steccherinum ochraceum]
MVADHEHHLDLVGGRTLHYAEAGYPHSNDIVLFFHGAFAVGSIPEPLPLTLRERRVHSIAPTLPGWGTSSPPSNLRSYSKTVCEDVATLIRHLHPNGQNLLRLYIAGVSFGTVAAQMLYGAPYDVFPFGDRIVGLLLVAPYSPFRMHKGYTKCLSWSRYFSIGPWAKHLPLNIVSVIRASRLKDRLSTPEHATGFFREQLSAHMTSKDKKEYEAWLLAKGKSEMAFEDEVGEMMRQSVEGTWAGFIQIPKVLHAKWGYKLKKLGRDHEVSVLLVTMGADREGTGMGDWLAKHMENVERWEVQGSGALGWLYMMDEIWAKFLAHTDSNPHVRVPMPVPPS